MGKAIRRPGAVTGLVPWFGAKRGIADEVVAAIGPHRVYWEPFCGSLAVLFSKPAVRMETVNDLHGDLVNLIRVVQDDRDGAALFDRLARCVFSQDAYERALARLENSSATDPLTRAADFFVASWMGRNGLAGTTCERAAGLSVRYTSTGGDPAGRFKAAVDSLPEWWHRLRSVAVLNGCGIALCERIEDRDGTAVYCDPPYLDKNGQYRHDFTAADHTRLAAALRRFARTRVVVSYYQHPDLADLYPGWEVRPVASRKQMANGSGGRGAAAPEVLLINRLHTEQPRVAGKDGGG